jgi:hypothetical protein
MMLHQAEVPEPCTDEDIWAKPTKYAVIKKGNVRAIKLFEYKDEAEDLAATISGSRIEVRPGVATRCQSYCPVSDYCVQWAADPRRPSPSTLGISSLMPDLEPGAVSPYRTAEKETIYSIAISLKRIADALTGTDTKMSPLMSELHGCLADALHNAAQRMGR